MIIDPINPFSQEFVDRFIYTIAGHIKLLGVLLLGIVLIIVLFILMVFFGVKDEKSIRRFN